VDFFTAESQRKGGAQRILGDLYYDLIMILDRKWGEEEKGKQVD
jgi:hypothetical protein